MHFHQIPVPVEVVKEVPVPVERVVYKEVLVPTESADMDKIRSGQVPFLCLCACVLIGMEQPKSSGRNTWTSLLSDNPFSPVVFRRSLCFVRRFPLRFGACAALTRVLHDVRDSRLICLVGDATRDASAVVWRLSRRVLNGGRVPDREFFVTWTQQ
jgi:hypothetical protein